MGPSRRTFCAGLAASAALPAGMHRRSFDAVVATTGGTHRSLAAALAEAPAGDAPYAILLGRGRWQEKLNVRRANVTLTGEDRRETILTASVASGHDKPGGGTWGTYGSATLTVEAPGFTARNLPVENGFDYRSNLLSGIVHDAQAVA